MTQVMSDHIMNPLLSGLRGLACILPSTEMKQVISNQRSNQPSMPYCDIEVVSEHDVKSVRIRSYSGSYFPAFGLNTGTYGPE